MEHLVCLMTTTKFQSSSYEIPNVMTIHFHLYSFFVHMLLMQTCKNFTPIIDSSRQNRQPIIYNFTIGPQVTSGRKTTSQLYFLNVYFLCNVLTHRNSWYRPGNMLTKHLVSLGTNCPPCVSSTSCQYCFQVGAPLKWTPPYPSQLDNSTINPIDHSYKHPYKTTRKASAKRFGKRIMCRIEKH